MKEKYNLFRHVLNEPKHKTMTISEIEKLLDDELSKNDIDLELVDELSLTLIELKGKEVININTEEKLCKLLDKIDNNKKKKYHVPKWFTGVAAACLILAFGNTYTVKAWNMNIFSFIVEFTKDGAIINFEEEPKEEIVLPTSDDDPYGIIAKCKENGIENIETPHYIPEGFILTEFESDNNGFSNYIHFTYEKENQLISLTFEEYPDKPPESIGIPSDEHNIYEISLNGHVAAMSKEDNQINVLCIYDLKLIGLFTDGVDYSECDKILESYNIS